MKKIFNFEFNKAESIFVGYLQKNPGSVESKFLLSKLYLWKYLGSKLEPDLDRFLKSSEQVIKLAEEKLDVSDNVKTTYFLGAIHAARAIAFSMDNNMSDAFWAGKKSTGILEDIIDENPDFYPAYLELGMITYALSYVEGFASFALGIAGMDADKELGIEYLEKALKGGIYPATESAFYISQAFSDYLQKHSEAEKFLLKPIADYPGNILFKYQLALIKTRNFEINGAIDICNEIIETGNGAFHQTLAFTYLLKGDLLLKSGEFKKSVFYLQEFLKISRDINYSGMAYYYLSLAQLFLGNNIEFQRYSLLARQGNPDLQEDNFAGRRSRFLFDLQPGDGLITLLKAEIFTEGGRFTIADSLLKSIDLQQLDVDFKALYCYLTARVFSFMGRQTEAIDAARKVLSFNLENEKWLIPAANLLIAKAHFALNDSSSAREFMELAEDENEYDFINKFKNDITLLKLRLN